MPAHWLVHQNNLHYSANSWATATIFTAFWETKSVRGVVFPMKYTSSWRSRDRNCQFLRIRYTFALLLWQSFKGELKRQVWLSLHIDVCQRYSTVPVWNELLPATKDCVPCARGWSQYCSHLIFPSFTFISSYILSIQEHIVFLENRLQKQGEKMCFPRARWLAGLYSYKDLFTRGFTGEDTQDMMVGIKKKKNQGSSQD